jgi:hypothetical protein
MEIHDLVDRFGRAADLHVASVLVGAGLSMQAGLPGWDALIEPLAGEIGLSHVGDAPLAAEYFEQSPLGGRNALEQRLLAALSGNDEPSEGHRLVTELGVSEVWTTNFDPLLELASPNARVVFCDEQAGLYGAGGRVIVKMNGGFTASEPPSWQAPPVITRGDFERYDIEHPRLWALLQAAYLTRTMLFVGFSFADPNIELILRLARRQGTAGSNQHLAVLRRPPDPADAAEHDLKVRDLEANGVEVCEIDEFDGLLPLLRALKRRTRPPRLFVSGSGGEEIRHWCDQVGSAIARHRSWEIASLVGDAGWGVTRRVGLQRQADLSYEPEALLLYFRAKSGEPPPTTLTDRIGTAIYSAQERHPLVDDVIESCRAVVVIGGGDRTLEEIELALERGLGVVPVAASGGAAEQAWEAAGREDADPRRLSLGGRRAPPDLWRRLADSDEFVVAQALERLLAQALYS